MDEIIIKIKGVEYHTGTYTTGIDWVLIGAALLDYCVDSSELDNEEAREMISQM